MRLTVVINPIATLHTKFGFQASWWIINACHACTESLTFAPPQVLPHWHFWLGLAWLGLKCIYDRLLPPAWITSLFRELVDVPMASADSKITTSLPCSAKALAAAKPTTPARKPQRRLHKIAEKYSDTLCMPTWVLRSRFHIGAICPKCMGGWFTCSYNDSTYAGSLSRSTEST